MEKEIFFDYKEFVEHKYYYLTKMLQEKENTFLTFYYGPYLIYHTDIELLHKIPRCDVKNELILYFIDIVKLISFKYYESYKSYKEYIVKKIKDLKENPYRYSDTVISFASKILEELKKKQMEEKILESAMLSCSPIVPYQNTLKYPELSEEVYSNKIKNISYSEIESELEKILLENLLNIFEHEEYIINTNMQNVIHLKKSPEIFFKDETVSIVEYYYHLIYMRYAYSEDNYQEGCEQLIKLNMTHNKLHKGERIDVSHVLETFNELSL